MKRSSGPRETADLSVSIHQQLNIYALAAGAAGAGVLALAQPVEAKIVYTPAHRVIGPDSKYLLDLNHDGIPDFTIANSYNCPEQLCFYCRSETGERDSRGRRPSFHAGSCFLGVCSQGGSDHWPKAPIFCQCSGVRWQRRLQPRRQPLV
jgi:hypothetical protein